MWVRLIHIKIMDESGAKQGVAFQGVHALDKEKRKKRDALLQQQPGHCLCMCSTLLYIRGCCPRGERVGHLKPIRDVIGAGR
jgi:hypothetical protein